MNEGSEPRDVREAADAEQTSAWPGPPQRPPAGGDTDATQAHDTRPAAGGQPAEPHGEFGDYVLLETIARGGMGVVFKARQRRANRLVALKMILGGRFSDPLIMRRFQVEAEAAASLDHPGIVPIYEVGEIQGQPFYSMGLVEGQSLADRVGEGPLEPRHAAQLALEITEAIAYAHGKGIIHRDLKPANVLLDQAGRPRVTDFGLAKQVDEGQDLTATGQVMGTPKYMPPEQALGETDQVGPPADVYSLGAILYELLTGRPPFQAASVHDVLHQVVHQEPVAVRQLNPAVDRDIETITAKCLQKSPAARYASAEELVRDLAAYLDGRPIAARPITAGARAVRWCRRHPAQAVAAAATAVALALAAGLLVGYRYQQDLTVSLAREQQLGQQLQAAVKEAEAQRGRAEAQEQLARRLSYAADINLAHRFWENNEVRRSLNLLDRLGQSEAAGLRGFEWRYLQRLGRPERLRHLPAAAPQDVAVSPDGATMVVATSEGIEVVRIADGSVIKRLGDGQPFASVLFSPRGDAVAAASDGRLAAWTTDDWAERFMLDDFDILSHRDRRPVMVWSDDGQWLAVGNRRQGAVMVDPRDGSTADEMEAKPGVGVLRQLAFPQGGAETLAGVYASTLFGRTRGTVLLWNRASGATRTLNLGASPIVRRLAFSPSGKLAISDADFSVLSGDEQRSRLTGHTGPINDMVFREGGEQLVSGSDDGTVILWDLAEAGIVRRLRGHLGGVTDVELAADGDTLVTASHDKTVRVWSLTKDARFQRCFKSPGSKLQLVRSLRWTPDSKTVTGRSLTSWLVARAGGESALRSDPDGSRTVALSTSRDGRLGVYHAYDGKGGEAKLLPDLIVRDVHRDVEVARIATPEGAEAATCGPRGDLLAIALRKGGIRIAEISGQTVAELTHPDQSDDPQAWQLVRFSPDGSRLLGATFRELWVWSLNETPGRPPGPPRRLLTVEDDLRWTAVTFSNDGRRLAALRQGRLWLCDTQGGVEPRQLPDTHYVTSVSFDREGERLLTAEGSEVVVRRADLTATGRLAGHTKPVKCITFHPDGQRLATGGEDRTIRIWDLPAGRELLKLTGHTDGIARLAFSPDGNLLASGGALGSLLIWDGRAVSPPDQSR